MDAFGAKFTAAGELALRLALDRAQTQLGKGCIPIAGAAVEVKDPSGELVCVSVGHNGRIPPRDDASACGYPTDHGETACVRGIAEISACDWSKIVFATTLGECTKHHVHLLCLCAVCGSCMHAPTTPHTHTHTLTLTLSLAPGPPTCL